VIPKVAALAAKEHGDAQKAIDTLYESGRLAEKQGTETVTIEHVDDAVQQAEINRFEKLIEGTTPHVKHILHALALLTADNPATEMFRTYWIYTLYVQLAGCKGLGGPHLSTPQGAVVLGCDRIDPYRRRTKRRKLSGTPAVAGPRDRDAGVECIRWCVVVRITLGARCGSVAASYSGLAAETASWGQIAISMSR